MKKNSLIKTLIILFGIFVLLTWIIPSGSYEDGFIKGKINPVGIFDLFKYPIYSIATFIQYGLVIISIGIFYSILSKTGVYSKYCNDIVGKIKRKKLFVGIVMFSLTLLSSLIGSPFVLFLFVPFVYDLVGLLGYNKKTAFAASVGSVLIGSISSLCGNNFALASTELFKVALTKDLIVRIILFLMISLLYINTVLSHSKEEKMDLLFYEKSKSRKSTLPIKILIIFTFIISILGVYDLSTFGFTLFNDIYNSLMSFEVNGFYLFQNLFKGISALGSWDNYDFVIFLTIMSIIISWVYTIDLKSIKEAIKDGFIKTYKPALYAMLAGLIFVVIFNNPSNIMETINNFILTNDFSLVKTSIGTISGTLFYNDYAWLLQSGFGNTLLSNSANAYTIIIMISEGIHGLLMLILPTSVILVAGLKLSDLDYKEWVKYIWKFILIVFIALIIVSIILMKFCNI